MGDATDRCPSEQWEIDRRDDGNERNRRIAGVTPAVLYSLLVAVLTAMVIAGCGGGSSSTSEGSTSGSSDASANGVDVAQVEEKLAPSLHPPKIIPLLTEPLKESRPAKPSSSWNVRRFLAR